MAELDPESIKRELAQLSHRRREVNERIRSLEQMRGRGRGFRGRGPPPGPLGGAHSSRDLGGGRDYASRDYASRHSGDPEYSGRHSSDRGGPSRHSSEYSEPRNPLDREPSRRGSGLLPPGEPRNPLDRDPSRRPYLARGPMEAELPLDRHEGQHAAGPRRRVQSAVVVGGEARTAHESEGAGGSGQEPAAEAPGGSGKRAAEGELLEDIPALKKRNRRLFGALLGTLQKFKEEDRQGSDLAQRRAELLQRAEAKKEEEARRLREEQRQDVQNRRLEEIHRKREINMMSDIKRLELLYAEKLARHDRLSAFLKTRVGPSVYWCPKQHSHVTLRLQEQQRQELQRWKGEQLEQLEREKAEVRQRFERAASRGEALAAEEGGAQGEEEGEHDDHEGGEEGEDGLRNGGGPGGEGAAPMEGLEQRQGEQPAADDRYEAVPAGQAAHDEEVGDGQGGRREDHKQGAAGAGDGGARAAAEEANAAHGEQEGS